MREAICSSERRPPPFLHGVRVMRDAVLHETRSDVGVSGA